MALNTRVGIVSWPMLDVQEHDSEWNASGLKSLEYNDKVSVNINHISTGNKLQAGSASSSSALAATAP